MHSEKSLLEDPSIACLWPERSFDAPAWYMHYRDSTATLPQPHSLKTEKLKDLAYRRSSKNEIYVKIHLISPKFIIIAFSITAPYILQEIVSWMYMQRVDAGGTLPILGQEEGLSCQWQDGCGIEEWLLNFYICHCDLLQRCDRCEDRRRLQQQRHQFSSAA